MSLEAEEHSFTKKGLFACLLVGGGWRRGGREFGDFHSEMVTGVVGVKGSSCQCGQASPLAPATSLYTLQLFLLASP